MSLKNQQTDLEFFIDYQSQPSRAVIILAKLLNLKFKISLKSLIALEHKQKEFREINPILTLPALKDHKLNFSIGESHSIMKYLCLQYGSENQPFYPKNNLLKKTEIDFFLDWFLGNVRAFTYPYMRGKFILPLFGIQGHINMEKTYNEYILKAFKNMENQFLKKGKKFIVGENLSIADISAYCELYQFFIMMKTDLNQYPNMLNWIKNCQKYEEIRELDQILIKNLQEMGSIQGKPHL
ncbi:Thioredoxin-like fold [Pseudocohnilembus persalinus]|uniref:Thioredoxin-like fold n=1 Tax=Pseudocohnilembus persalinus TaxID=266149 RepID=A0A0V0QDT4_PSEPJ|nr:Thioredoxin-like fold [Pseudocohnilembus persalinus]|eukprot:KRX00309.1 Thioredoxin-like fold [Pseudocohnilembus persalinus]